MNTAQVKVKKNGRAVSCAVPWQYKVVPLRECEPVNPGNHCETPKDCCEYWKKNVASDPNFNPDVECFLAVMINARYRTIGHYLVATGTVNSVMTHPRETFRAAIVAGASAVVLMHNHPSGDPSPSDGDLKVTTEMVRAGQLLKIEVMDHVIMGLSSAENSQGYISLMEKGLLLSGEEAETPAAPAALAADGKAGNGAGEPSAGSMDKHIDLETDVQTVTGLLDLMCRRLQDYMGEDGPNIMSSAACGVGNLALEASVRLRKGFDAAFDECKAMSILAKGGAR